ncbi:MAG: L,D-transpeptidase family protein [Collinsella sp.]|nr:L,D-transpeptidase family protein [Collinsella sp.]
MNDPLNTQRFERISAPAPGTPQHRAPKEPDEGKGGAGKRALIAGGILAALVVAAWGVGAFAFSRIYYPGTHIAGVDISLMNEETAVGRVEAAAQNYKLTITGTDFSFTYSPDSDALPVDVAERAHQVIASNDPLAWPLHLIEALTGKGGTARASEGTTQTELADEFDLDGFTAELSQAIDEYNAGRTGVFDAVSAYDEEAGAFTVEHALANVKVNKDRVLEDAKTALADLVSTVELDDSDFEKLAGDKGEDDLKRACDAANELIGTDVELKMGGQTVANLDGGQLATWISFDENLTPSLDIAAVTGWAQELDDGLDTVGTERTYTRPDGKVVTVSGGNYGWIVDSAALADAIGQAVANKQTGDLEIPLKSSGATFTKLGEKDWAEYVDVDLAEQHARYYDANGTLLWESGCITGNPNLGNETPPGVYRMNTCSRNVTLVGKKDPETGEPEYKTPVAYWMPFVGGAIGLHDASWQASSSFSNPNAYKSVGSHGCVNLPPSKAAELYDIVKPGICVIVHW